MPDRLSELRTLVAVVDEGGFAAAARLLHRSPPAITRTIADLEQRARTVLLERTTRRCRPTEAGRRLADQARSLLAAYDDALSEAAGEADVARGLVRVTAPLVFGREHVAPLVAAFQDQFPEVEVDLHLADRVVDLHDENYDLGVRIGPVADTSLIAFRVGEVRHVAVASGSYLEQRGIPLTPEALSAHEVVQHTNYGTTVPWVFRRPGGEVVSVTVRARFAVNQADAAVAAARAGRGIVRALSYQIDPAVRAGALVTVLEEFEPEPLPVHIVWPDSRRLVRRVRLLSEHLKALRGLRVLSPG